MTAESKDDNDYIQQTQQHQLSSQSVENLKIENDDGNINTGTSTTTNTNANFNASVRDSNHSYSSLDPHLYRPSWRPPTPPRGDEPDSESHYSLRNNSDTESSQPSSSWLHSLLPKNRKNAKSKKYPPPVSAFHIPNSLSASSDDSMVDRSLLLQDNSLSFKIENNDNSSFSHSNKKQPLLHLSASASSSPYSQSSSPSKKQTRLQKYSKRQKQKHKSDLEIRQKCDFFYTGMDELEAKRGSQTKSKWATKQTPASVAYTNESRIRNGYGEYFDPTLRRKFMEEYEMLNTNLTNNEIEHNNAEDQFDDDIHDDDDAMDFRSLFTFGCSPTSREKELNRRGLTVDDHDIPAISDIRKSSLSFMNNGRMQIRLPSDKVRLLMDDHLEAGILCVEKDALVRSSADRSSAQDDVNREEAQNSLFMADDENIIGENISNNYDYSLSRANRNEAASSLKELRYVLTIDQDLYKRVLTEVVDSQTPCGLYYCCHDYESKTVNINVAVGILFVVFSFIFWGTCEWPTD